jgi:chitinase
MHGRRTIGSILAVGLVATATCLAPAPVHAAGRWLTGYYVGYERDILPPDEIEWNALTHIVVGAAVPRKNGTIDTSFDLGTDGPAFARDVAERAHANNVVPILMIGGAGTHDGFKRAASRKKRKAFVRNLVATMNDLGFDGLDLDWEPITSKDLKPFSALVSALRSALPDAVLTAPVIPPTLTFPEVSSVYGQVAQQLDQVNVMTYNMEGAYSGWQSWHSSALDGAATETPSSVAVGVASFLAAGVPASKLGVGIGFFGDCWNAPVTGPRQAIGGANIVATDSEMSTTTIASTYYDAAAARFDEIAQVPYLTFAAPKGPPGCTYISYEDEKSIAAKGKWARDQGLSGAIVWTINQGHNSTAPPGQRDALLRAAKAAFGA